MLVRLIFKDIISECVILTFHVCVSMNIFELWLQCI